MIRKIIIGVMILSSVAFGKVRTKYIIDKNLSKLLSSVELDKKINDFLRTKDRVSSFELVDIKLSDNDDSPSALIIYKED